MWQVYDLLNQTIVAVEDKNDYQHNALFLNSLRYLRTAAKLKAKGSEENNRLFLQTAERTIEIATS